MNNLNKNTEATNLKIRKFLKQVGVESHKAIQQSINKSNVANEIKVTLEINNESIQEFTTKIE